MDNITAKFYCDTCELAKATKQYNWILRLWLIIKYSEIHTNFVGPITPYSFQDKQYFFTFTDGAT